MSGSLRLNGGTSGYSEITAPAVAGDQTFTLPAVGGELVTAPPGGSVVGYQQGIATLTSNAPLSSQGAYWFRIGNIITMQCTTLFSSGISDTATLWVGGIPYPRLKGPSGSLAAASGCGGYICYASTSTVDSILFNGTNSGLMEFRDGGGGRPAMAMNLFSNADVRWVVTYQTDDTTWTPINGATIS